MDVLEVVRRLRDSGSVEIKDVTRFAFVLNSIMVDELTYNREIADEYIKKELAGKITKQDVTRAYYEGIDYGYEKAINTLKEHQ